MQACPTCKGLLRRASTRDGHVYHCWSCGGRAVPLPVLAKTARGDVLRRLRNKSIHSAAEREKSCPLCARGMTKVDFTEKDRVIVLDVCGPCQLVWFDPGEYPAMVPGPSSRGDLAHEPPGPGDDERGFALTGPEHTWQILPAILGLPIEYGPNRLRDRAVITWGLAAIMAAVFVLLLRWGVEAFGEAILEWGFVSHQWSRHGGLTLLTSFFLHAGWWHLIGNAYFLLVFGDNVEDHLGRMRFVLLVAASHLCGMLAHAAFSTRPELPCVGASAGISGVIAYYAVVFPRAKIGIFLWLITLFRILRMPAMVGLLLFVVVQIVGAYLTRGEPGGVSYVAHLGGLAVGAAVGISARVRRASHAA